MAALVSEAVDRYLAEMPDAADALDATFGLLLELEVPPRDEWGRG